MEEVKGEGGRVGEVEEEGGRRERRRRRRDVEEGKGEGGG